jgi:pyruvate carboxylase
MYDAVEFRRRAQRLFEQADEPGLSQTTQTALLRMASKWVELADDADLVNAMMGDTLQTSPSNKLVGS